MNRVYCGFVCEVLELCFANINQDEAICSVAGETFCCSSLYKLSDLKSRIRRSRISGNTAQQGKNKAPSYENAQLGVLTLKFLFASATNQAARSR